jgi:hypothetical protein
MDKRLIVKVVAVALLVVLIIVFGFDTEVPQGDLSLPEQIDLGLRVLAYEDPLRAIDSVNITTRRVLQDALWWCVNDPTTTDADRAACFYLISKIHEASTVEFSDAEEALVLDALQQVWGPAVIEQVTTEVGQ